jgi:Cu/Ag efflux pump CusA
VLVILVFVPLLGLSGVEGKLFTPIAVATMISMVASFVVSLTLIPVLCSFLLHPKGMLVHRDGWLVRLLKRFLSATVLRLGFISPIPTLLVVLAAIAAAFLLYPRMGQDFLPAFQEDTALVAVTSAPGTSLEEMNRISDVVESQILQVPEVRQVGRRLGRAERGDHVVPVSTAEFDVDFHDPSTMKTARSRQAVLRDIGARVRTVPGIFAVVGGPLADRIGHMRSGVSAPLAIKIFGPDISTLRRNGSEVQALAKSVPGLSEARIDQQASIPQIRIEADRDKAAAYGITPGELNNHLSTLVGGKVLAELREGQTPVNLVLRLPSDLRDSPEKIAEIPIPTGSGRQVPIRLVGDVREAKGPNVIFRENGQRRLIVAIKPTARDVGKLVTELQAKVRENVSLPTGYYISYEGEFQARNDAAQRILLLSAGVFVVAVFLLATYFQSVSLALQVLLNIPLALAGGLVSTWLLVGNISIATLVGAIAVGGIAARNGIMMLSHYLHLMKHEGEEFSRQMVERGTLERMVPVLMTALSAGIALVPFVLAADQPGKEILHPVAVVIVGGLVSSTLLDFVVTPILFLTFAKKAALRALQRNAAAAQ